MLADVCSRFIEPPFGAAMVATIATTVTLVAKMKYLAIVGDCAFDTIGLSINVET
jgi:hypothetical protein